MSAAPVQRSALHSWAQWEPDAGLQQLAPRHPVLTRPEDFQRVWHAWRGEEEPPEIDWVSSLAVVYAANGLNDFTLGSLWLDEAGNLTVEFAVTERGPPGFCYLIVVVDRAGVRTVNGVAVLPS
jgi:hypothetical protein